MAQNDSAAAPSAKPPRRRLLLILSVVVLIALLVAAVTGFVILLRRSSDAPVSSETGEQGALPGSESGIGQPTASPGAEPTTTPSPSPASAAEGTNLLVTVSFTRTPSFSFTITGAAVTEQEPTIQHIAPPPGAPYSLLRVLSASGDTLVEERFTVATRVIAEGADLNPSITELSSSTETLVVHVPGSARPAEVIVASPQGTIYSQRSVTEQLLRAPLRRLLARITDWLPGRRAQAQSSPGFTIAVISDQGAPGLEGPVAAEAEDMVANILPWQTYADHITVVPVAAADSLGCGAVAGNNGGTFPACSDTGRVISAVNAAGVDWDAIIVVTNIACNCGSVAEGFPPVAAVGSGITNRVIAHELGHAVGKMADEYLYLFGLNGPVGPNCFTDQASCEQATEDFPDALCVSGCNSPVAWRPATKIMHNTYDVAAYGPLEACIMEQTIAEAVGAQATCGDGGNSGPDGTSNGTYYGGGR